MKKSMIIEVVSFFLLVLTTGCFAADLPKMTEFRTYEAYKLPDFMTEVWPYHGEYLVYRDKESGLEGITDLDGNILIEPQCEYILDDMKRLGRESIYGQAYGLICSSDDDVQQGIWIDLFSMTVTDYENYMWARDYEHFVKGYIYPDKTVELFDEPDGGYIYVMDYQTEKIGIVDKNNKIVLPPIFSQISYFFDDLAIVSQCENGNCKYGYIDSHGNLAIDLKYTDVTRFDKGYATVNTGKRWILIEKDGSMPFEITSWNDINQIERNNFVAEAKDGSWYRLVLPESKKSSIVLQTSNSLYNNSRPSSTSSYGSSSGKNGGVKVGSCSGLSYLKPGDHAEVINTKSLRIRKTPNGEPISQQAFPDRDIYITDGPVCKDNIIWVEINFLGFKGWAAESADGEYFLHKK